MAAYPYLLLRSHNYLSQHLSHVEVLHYKAYIYFSPCRISSMLWHLNWKV